MTENPYSSPTSEPAKLQENLLSVDWRARLPIVAVGGYTLKELRLLPPKNRTIVAEEPKQKRTIWTYLTYLGLLLMVLVYLSAWIAQGGLQAFRWSWAVAVPWLLVAAMLCVFAWLAWMLLRGSQSLKDYVAIERRYHITEQSIEQSFEGLYTRYEWRLFSDYGANLKSLGLWIADAECLVLPRRFFASEEDWQALLAMTQELCKNRPARDASP